MKQETKSTIITHVGGPPQETFVMVGGYKSNDHPINFDNTNSKVACNWLGTQKRHLCEQIRGSNELASTWNKFLDSLYSLAMDLVSLWSG